MEATGNEIALLEGAPLFGGMEREALEAAYQVAYRRHVRQGEFFFFQGDPATTFYIVQEGRARLSQLTPEGHQVIIRYLGPGNGMGIIVALSDTVYPLSAEAVTDCLALAWDADTVIDLMERYPRLALNGMRLVAGRFRNLQNRYRELATERVERRVARALLRLARQTGRRTDEGVLLDLPLSRQDLGEMTGTTLYTVSRILRRWEQQGLIASGRERVVICNPHGLVTIAEDLPEPE
ncbi:MAG: Crp/Fnr family transcriptional regulator [Candidatus Promineifilaceae bacterium]|nr:Crp/Fnr family transcriptional regulator [Candidatus Promineifilaceae bacterium]